MATITSYTKQKIDQLLALKSSTGHTHTGSEISGGSPSVDRLNFQGHSAYLDAEGGRIVVGGDLTYTANPQRADITTFFNDVEGLSGYNFVQWRGGVALLHMDVKKTSAGNLQGWNMAQLPAGVPTPKITVDTLLAAHHGSATTACSITLVAGSQTITSYFVAGENNRYKGIVPYFY